MMLGTLIIFRVLPFNDKLRMNKFCREFYGYDMKSNFGKYAYHRTGFLEKIKHINPVRGVVIVSLEDTEKVLSFLDEYHAETFVRMIVLNDLDIKELGLTNSD